MRQSQSRKATGLKLAYATITAAMLAASATAVYAAGPVAADAAKYQNQKLQKAFTPKLAIKLKCSHYGTPVEFPDDIQITNNSSFSLAAGTKVKWSMPSINKSGIVTLPALAPGKTAFFSNAVPAMPAGMPCSAKTI